MTEYTHIHIQPWAKLKQSNKNTVQQIDPANKGNQKLYLPVRTKLIKAHWKPKLKQGVKWGIKQWKQN